MDLNFITQLKEEEWISLINFSTQHYSKKENKLPPHPVTWVNVLQENERRDIKGNRYSLVTTGDGIHILSSYRVNDFSMATEDAGAFGIYPKISFDEELRIFLTSRFGKDYLKALEAYHQTNISEELSLLSQYVSLGEKQK